MAVFRNLISTCGMWDNFQRLPIFMISLYLSALHVLVLWHVLHLSCQIVHYDIKS